MVLEKGSEKKDDFFLNKNVKINKLFHHLTIELFVKKPGFSNELDLDLIKSELSFLDPLLPFSSALFFDETLVEREKNVFRFSKKGADLTITISKGFEDTIYVIQLFFKKVHFTNFVFNKLKELLSVDDWSLLSEERFLRTDKGVFYLRLSFDDLKKGVVKLKNSGSVVKFSFNLALFPNNKDSEDRMLRRLFD